MTETNYTLENLAELVGTRGQIAGLEEEHRKDLDKKSAFYNVAGRVSDYAGKRNIPFPKPETLNYDDPQLRQATLKNGKEVLDEELKSIDLTELVRNIPDEELSERAEGLPAAKNGDKSHDRIAEVQKKFQEYASLIQRYKQGAIKYESIHKQLSGEYDELEKEFEEDKLALEIIKLARYATQSQDVGISLVASEANRYASQLKELLPEEDKARASYARRNLLELAKDEESRELVYQSLFGIYAAQQAEKEEEEEDDSGR